jgi:hypothetical protein
MVVHAVRKLGPRSEPPPEQSGPSHEPPPEQSEHESEHEALPSGLPNLGNSSYITSVRWFLNAIPEFREDIIESGSENPLIVAFGEIFKGINSPDEIKEDCLRELLETNILHALNEYGERESNEEKFKLDGEDDASNFIDWCLMNISSEENQLVECFKCECLKITEEKSNSANKKQKMIHNLC